MGFLCDASQTTIHRSYIAIVLQSSFDSFSVAETPLPLSILHISMRFSITQNQCVVMMMESDIYVSRMTDATLTSPISSSTTSTTTTTTTTTTITITSMAINDPRKRYNSMIGERLSSLPNVILTCVWHFFNLKGIICNNTSICLSIYLSRDTDIQL
jgi:hypothetical protein